MTNTLSYKDLLALKIDVTTDDYTEFQDVVSLVDKPEFLKDIQIIRKKMELSKLVTYSLENMREMSIRWYISYVRFCLGHRKGAKILQDEALNLMRKYNKPFHRYVIIRAILFGRIETTYSHNIVQIFNNDTKIYNSVIAIIPNLRTTDEEVRDALKRVKDMYKSKQKYLKAFQPGFGEVSRAHRQISAQREWYWMRLSGMKYKDIADAWIEKYPDFEPTPEENRVNKDIRAYKLLLKQ